MYCVFHHISGHLPRQIWFWKISTKTWASVRPPRPLLGQMPNFFRKCILRASLIVVVFTRGVQHFIQIFCYNRFVYMFKICKRIQPGQNSVSCMRKITHSWSLLLYISNPLFITVYRFFVETQVLCVYKMLFMYHARTDYTCTATLWHFYTSLGQYRIFMHIYTSLVQYRISMRL